MKEKNLPELINICLECGTQCGVHSYTFVLATALASITQDVKLRKQKKLQLQKQNKQKQLEKFNKTKQLVNNIVFNKIKCSGCNIVKLRHTIKEKDYIDENGRDWNGKKCPSCRSIEYEKRKLNRVKTKNCVHCGGVFLGILNKQYCSIDCRKNKENNKRKVIRKCLTCKTLLSDTNRLKCSGCYLPKKTYTRKPKPSKVPYNQTCVKCGVVFMVARKKKYCSSKCSKDPVLHKLYKKLRKRAIKQAKPKWCKWKDIVEVYVNCPEGMEVDHIHPLKHPDVCGLHVPWNLEYLSKEDNNKKSNSFDYTYENLGWKK